MRDLLWSSIVVALFVFSSACSMNKKPLKDGMESTIWVKSTMNEPITHHDKNGVYAYACYGITYDEDLKREQMDHIITDWKPFCGMLTDFDYEEGYYYRLKIKQTLKENKKLTWIEDKGNWKVLEVLTKELDRHYERVEEYTMWLGPKIIEVQCFSPMVSPEDCKFDGHQCQRGESYDENGTWEQWTEHSLIKDYEEGYIYKISYKKQFLSDFDARMIQDHPGYSIGDIKILSKTKI